jgi:hypothetical protein
MLIHALNLFPQFYLQIILEKNLIFNVNFPVEISFYRTLNFVKFEN